jgi:hypothetical protein
MSKLNDKLKKSIKSHTLTEEVFGFLLMKIGYANHYMASVNTMYKTSKSIEKQYSKYIDKTDFPKRKTDENKKIWICWLQGIENAPQLVKDCYASICYHIKDMEIVVIDKDNYSQYVTLPDYVIDKWQKGIIPPAHFSDILRLQLLIEHGGLWVDSTTYFTDKLPSYITDTDFFVYQGGWFNEEMINMGSWLIYNNTSNNILLEETQNLIFEYWKTHNYLKQYFLMHIFFRMVSDYYSEEWKKVPYYNQIDQHILANEICNEFDEKRLEQIKNITPIHKLSNKFDLSKNDSNCYYNMLSKLYK